MCSGMSETAYEDQEKSDHPFLNNFQNAQLFLSSCRMQEQCLRIKLQYQYSEMYVN